MHKSTHIITNITDNILFIYIFLEFFDIINLRILSRMGD